MNEIHQLIKFFVRRKKVEKSYFEKLISRQFSNFFNAYAKAFNKQQDRVGRLFRSSVKRKLITSKSQLINTARYIHFNPAQHGFVTDLRAWEYSSYHQFLTGKFTNINGMEVIKWSGGIEKFIDFHNQMPCFKIEFE